MYKVMLVDDDYPVLELLSETIPWQGLGLTLGGAFENGLAALEAARHSMPDILVTDIGMPKMDGLELIRELKGKKPELRVAILSCHSEFHYARKAMQLQVQDYIVKDTLDPDDLQQVLARFAISLDEERKQSSEQHRLRHMVDRSLDALKGKWIQAAVQQPLLHADGWRTDLESFGLPVEGRVIVPAVGRIDYRRIAERRFASDETLQFAVTNVMEEIIRDAGAEAMVFPYRGTEWTVFHSFRLSLSVNGYDEVRRLLGLIQRSLERALKLTMSFVIGEMSDPKTNGLKHKVMDLLIHDGQRFYMDNGTIASFRSLRGSDQDLFAHYDEASRQFRECVMRRSPAEVKAKVKEWTAVLKQDEHDPEIVKDWALKLLLDIRLKHHSLHQFRKHRSAESLHKEVTEIGSLHELSDWLAEHLLSAIQAEEARTNTQRKEVLDACQYVARHLGERIGLEEVADYLHLNPSYFSRLFKRETGETFIEYVMRTKMQRAKELLDQTAYPVAKICEMLGYDNQSYFNKLFKGCYGVTPTEYRNRGALQSET